MSSKAPEPSPATPPASTDASATSDAPASGPRASEDAPSSAAATYAELGLSPIRLYGVTAEGVCRCPRGAECPPRNRGKHPPGTGWERAPIDAAKVDDWIDRGGNVGLRMGEQPDGRQVIALDEDEPGALARAEATLGALPSTLTARTGGGGTHRIYTWPSARPLPKNRVRVLAGIDVRSQGGQIVVAPSRTAKGEYTWTSTADVAELPAAWCDALAAEPSADGAREREAPTSRATSRVDRVVGVMYPTYAAGGRHELVRALGGYLARHDWPDDEIRAIVERLPSDTVPARVTQALGAAASARAGHEAPGWSALLERLGADDAARLESYAMPDTSSVTRAIERHRARAAKPNADPDAGAAGADDGAAWAHAPDGAPADACVLGRAMSFAAPEAPIAYLCAGLCLAPSDGKISIVAGDPGGGKGPIANHLAVCFALGARAFGAHECAQANVLLLDCEGARLTMRRLRRLTRGNGRDPAELDGKLHVFDASAANMLSDAYLDAVRSYIAEHAIGVIVLDSYTSAMLATGVEANAPEFARLAKALGQLDVLVIAVAHANKGAARKGGSPTLADVAYSGAFAAMAQTAIVVHYPSEDRNLIHVACARAPEQGFAGFRVRFADAPGDALRVTLTEPAEAPEARKEREHAATVAANADEIERVLREAEACGAGPLTVTQARNAAGFNNKQWQSARAECDRRGSVRETPGRRGGLALWYLPPHQRTPKPAAPSFVKRRRAGGEPSPRGTSTLVGNVP